MDKAIPLHLRQPTWLTYLVDLDDFLLCSDTFDEHLQTLSEILLSMWKASLSIGERILEKTSKISFYTS